VAPDGKTAQIPSAWREAFNWYFDAVWKGHYVPTGDVAASDFLSKGNSQASGKVAMNAAWTWSISSLVTGSYRNPVINTKSWDIAVLPSWRGTTSSPLDAQSFHITKASQNPEAAMRALSYIMADPTLLAAYGGMPAAKALQPGWFKAYDAWLAPYFPNLKVTWSVVEEMSKYPAAPSHEEGLPNDARSNLDTDEFLTRIRGNPGFDINVELDKLQATLQTDYDAAAAQ